MKFIKENLRVIVAVVIALILIFSGVILLATQEDNGETANKEHENIEEQITEITGMTSEGAIDIVKKNFYSDNYKFSVEVTNDSLYKITVINTIDESKMIYYVDPNNGNAYIDIDTN